MFGAGVVTTTVQYIKAVHWWECHDISTRRAKEAFLLQTEVNVSRLLMTDSEKYHRAGRCATQNVSSLSYSSIQTQVSVFLKELKNTSVLPL